MKNICVAVLAFGLLSAAVVSTQQAPAAVVTAATPAREWAFPVKNGDLTPEPDGPRQVPGSSKTYQPKEIDDLNNAVDWFPNEHPAPPSIVLKAKGDALACGVCHLMNGAGHPESAMLAGLSADYITRQMMDFKSVARLEPGRMNKIAQAMSDEEIRQAAEWFSKLPPVKGWTQVKEASTAPKSFVGGGRMRFRLAAGGTEPIAARIITLPLDVSRVTRRDPHIGFEAYVPPGTIKRGETLVKTGDGGKTIACGICHGDQLQGLAFVPRIAGLHPIYIARQLFTMKSGDRHGAYAELMKKPVEKLTDADILAIAAYVGGLN